MAKPKPSNGKNKRIAQLEDMLANEQRYTANLERELKAERDNAKGLAIGFNKLTRLAKENKTNEQAMRLHIISLLAAEEDE